MSSSSRVLPIAAVVLARHSEARIYYRMYKSQLARRLPQCTARGPYQARGLLQTQMKPNTQSRRHTAVTFCYVLLSASHVIQLPGTMNHRSIGQKMDRPPKMWENKTDQRVL